MAQKDAVEEGVDAVALPEPALVALVLRLVGKPVMIRAERDRPAVVGLLAQPRGDLGVVGPVAVAHVRGFGRRLADDALEPADVVEIVGRRRLARHVMLGHRGSPSMRL